jgi:hypothetical protein
VADSPHTGSAFCHRRSRASASCTCTPRLLPISSCHSSTTTAVSVPSCSRADACDSIRHRLSGVVTSAWGRARAWRARSEEPVSPVRRPTSQSSPSALADSRSVNAVSAARARIGVIHSTRRPVTGVSPAARSSAPSQTAKVLPDRYRRAAGRCVRPADAPTPSAGSRTPASHAARTACRCARQARPDQAVRHRRGGAARRSCGCWLAGCHSLPRTSGAQLAAERGRRHDATDLVAARFVGWKVGVGHESRMRGGRTPVRLRFAAAVLRRGAMTAGVQRPGDQSSGRISSRWRKQSTR